MAKDYLLTRPRSNASLALFGAFGVGLSLMVPSLFFVGLFVCWGAAVATIVQHRGEFIYLYRRVIGRPFAGNVSSDIWVAVPLVILEIIIPAALLFYRGDVQGVSKNDLDAVQKHLDETIGKALGVPSGPTYKGLPKIPKADVIHGGALKPANLPTPSNGCDGLDTPDTTKLLMGNNAAGFRGLGKLIVLMIDDKCEAVSIEKDNEGIYLSAEVNDGSGLSPAKIVRNDVSALNGENYTATQSADESSILLTNRNGRVLLDAKFLNKTTLKIRGVFGCEGGKPVVVEDNQPLPGIFMSMTCMMGGYAAFDVQTRPKPRP